MINNIRIAFILPSLANRGPIVFTRYLIEQLIYRVTTVDVYYFDDIVDIDFPCVCHRINFLEKIDFSRYDIIHSTMFRPDLYVVLHKKSITNANCKVISGLHNYINSDMVFNYGKIKGTLISKIWFSLLKKFDSRIYSSKDMESFYCKKIGKKSDAVIPYGISKVEYNNKLDLPKQSQILKIKQAGYKIVGAVGLLIYRKGYHQLISALVELKDYALLLVGDGPELSTLMQQAKDLGVAERVIFVGFYDASAQYYKYMDIYCLCSYSEGFGLAMLEALSAALPLACSNLPIYDDYFTSENVAFFTPDNIGELISAIRYLTVNMSIFKQCSKDLFDDFFDSKIMADRHVSHYLKCIDKADK